jgi:protoheme IX farnesyltransferase
LGDVHAQLTYDVTITEIFKNYWMVTKPGIILGNIITAAGGFFLASNGHINIELFISVMAGISLVIASGCVFNNFIDREIDRKMSRTMARTLARDAIPPVNAIIYALILGISGVALLLTATDRVCVALVVFGFIIYVVFYSLFLKRRSLYAVYVGSIAGAIPPVAGYCSVTGLFDLGAWILFLIFILWQIPHCYASAILRFEDYLAAGIPVAPVSLGLRSAKRHIVFYVIAFLTASLMLTLTGFTGFSYLGITAVLGIIWLCIAWTGFKASDDRRWARLLFDFSIICIIALSLMMSIDCKVP